MKYFGGEEYEAERYTGAIGEYQTFERRVVRECCFLRSHQWSHSYSIVSLNLLNLAQTFIITSGLLVGSMIVASRITKGQSNTSDFVVFITYYAQVGIPLTCPPVES